MRHARAWPAHPSLARDGRVCARPWRTEAM